MSVFKDDIEQDVRECVRVRALTFLDKVLMGNLFDIFRSLRGALHSIRKHLPGAIPLFLNTDVVVSQPNYDACHDQITLYAPEGHRTLFVFVDEIGRSEWKELMDFDITVTDYKNVIFFEGTTIKVSHTPTSISLKKIYLGSYDLRLEVIGGSDEELMQHIHKNYDNELVRPTKFQYIPPQYVTDECF